MLIWISGLVIKMEQTFFFDDDGRQVDIKNARSFIRLETDDSGETKRTYGEVR